MAARNRFNIYIFRRIILTTIADKLSEIKNCKTDIASAIEAKGVSVAGASFSDYASLIRQIASTSGCDRIFHCTYASSDPLDPDSNLPYPPIVDGMPLSDGDTVLLLGEVRGANGLYRYVDSGTSGELERLDNDILTHNLVFVTAGSSMRHVFSNAADIDHYIDISTGALDMPLSSDVRNELVKKENGLYASTPVSARDNNLVQYADDGIFAGLPDHLNDFVTVVHAVEGRPVTLNDPNAVFSNVDVATLRAEYGDDARVLLTSRDYKGIFSLKDPSSWEGIFVNAGYVYASGKYGNHKLYDYRENGTVIGWMPVTGDIPNTFGNLLEKPATLAGYGITDAASANELAAHETNRGNPHQVSKEQVGLDKVDNTSDLDKPVSTAVLAALGGKRDNIAATSPASSTSLTVTGNTVYTFGELSALTVTSIETSHNESVIYFTASAAGTTISLPSGTPIVDSLTVTAGKKHVLTFMNGIVVLGVCA